MKIQTPQCAMCGKTDTMDIDEEGYIRMRNGEHVQNVFPDMSADQREMLVSGTHPTCWDLLFSDD